MSELHLPREGVMKVGFAVEDGSARGERRHRALKVIKRPRRPGSHRHILATVTDSKTVRLVWSTEDVRSDLLAGNQNDERN